MTALHNAMATRNRFLTTAKALVRALRQAEFERPAADSAPFLFPFPPGCRSRPSGSEEGERCAPLPRAYLRRTSCGNPESVPV